MAEDPRGPVEAAHALGTFAVVAERARHLGQRGGHEHVHVVEPGAHRARYGVADLESRREIDSTCLLAVAVVGKRRRLQGARSDRAPRGGGEPVDPAYECRAPDLRVGMHEGFPRDPSTGATSSTR